MASLVDRFGPGGVTIDAAELEQMAERACYCPDDCACHHSWRPTVCGCSAHDAPTDEDADRAVMATVSAEIMRAEPDAAPSVVASERMPYNAVTGTEYRGGNIIRLATAEAMGGYGSGGWAGFKQWLSVGRVVRKGEHGTACITVVSVTDDKGRAGTRPRGFRVFHFDQTTELVEGEQ